LRIRPASEPDVEQIEILKAPVQFPPQIAHMRIWSMRQGRSTYLVAEDNGRIVGHVWLKYAGTERRPFFPDIEDLYIHPDYRRQGVATQLIQTCERHARARGYTRIGLAAAQDTQDPARILYARLGFQPLPLEPYVHDIYDGVPFLVIDMEKSLSE
jgi:GNAT superfamily N-acetyltransferase